ncbi:beta-N-acetylhexosaminidase [Paraneptunicella aestuarii]|nr:beta-N-acetylhexosaminidase [Paraneptunicella aestuarii]
MLDLTGYELTPEEKEILEHPLVGGVILFTRNYHDVTQVRELVRQTRAAARNELLFAVDHEGGRVQRFRQGFSAIPAMGSLQNSFPEDINTACQYAKSFGWLMAAEVQAVDIDISFAPVLDIHGISEVIGDRSFSDNPQDIISIGAAFIEGMREAGMKSTGKHFPGHGNVLEDSHIAIPVDKRARGDVFNIDMSVFKAVHEQGLLDAVMPAHVIYPDVDDMPAGFSEVWIKQILRQQLGFDGVVFSDDLAMEGATGIGSFTQRAEAAFNAGCDMALVCNHRKGAIQVLDELSHDYINATSNRRLATMLMSQRADNKAWAQLQQSTRWNEAQKQLEKYHEQ